MVETTIDIERRTVINVEQARYQPPPTSEEINHAIAITVSDERISSKVKSDNLEGRGIS